MKKFATFVESVSRNVVCLYAFGLMVVQILLFLIDTDWIQPTKTILLLTLFVIPTAIGFSLRKQINTVFDKYGFVSFAGGINLIWLGIRLAHTTLTLAIFFAVMGVALLFNSRKGLGDLIKPV